MTTKSQPAKSKRPPGKWSARVTRTSNALDLESDVFSLNDPAQIARSLKRSVERSRRRKGTPFQSAMSMLNFYINRAGKSLSAARKAKLEKAKDRLRELFNRRKVVAGQTTSRRLLFSRQPGLNYFL